MTQGIRQVIVPVLGLLLFVAALAALHHELGQYRYHDVVAAMHDLPRLRIVLAVVLTLASYLVLTGYDTLAFRYIGHPLPYARIALASFIAYAFSHNVGGAFLGGGAVRYRLYSSWGLSAVDIAKVVGFNALTFWLGFATLAAAALLLRAGPLPPALPLPPGAVPVVVLVVLGLAVTYLVATAVRTTPLRVGSWELSLPRPRLALAQVVISCLDWTLVAAALWVLLPDGRPPYPAFTITFLVAQAAGLVSNLPGGLGVFETVLVLLLAPQLPGSAVLGSLLVYRAIYYVLPLVIAGVLLGAHEALARREQVARVGRLFGRWVPSVIPQAFAATTFVAGVILLASGATPAAHGRMAPLGTLVPLPVLELSHFFGSLVGVWLLILARGLQRRLDAAYFLTVGLLAAGAVLSLLKGFDYEEAIVLTIMLAALVPCRAHFRRRAFLLDQPFTTSWIVAIALVMAGTVWLLLLSHRKVAYSHELWWQFELARGTPRALRATVGALVVAIGYGIARLLRPHVPEAALPTPADLDRAAQIVARARASNAHLALLGDKSLLFNEAGTAFLMYGVEGRSWVAMGDPVGPTGEARELAWRFREICDRHDGWPVFYEVGAHGLPLYLDLGLGLIKLGEEARVPLTGFSLEGRQRKALRHSHRQVVQKDCTFSVLPAAEVAPLLGELRAVSDAWLDRKHTREKGFSLGFFDERYLVREPLAVVRGGDRIIAFANLWPGAEHDELSVDLMRFRPDDAPAGVMDFLFLEIMLWGAAHGYRWFSLGMAPLSGFEDRALAPLWTRLGAFLFRHGEHFYNFQGLRQYKSKFDPQWSPRYLASPGGLALPRILANVAALVSRGLRGVVAK